jgi:hypothetical protein
VVIEQHKNLTKRSKKIAMNLSAMQQASLYQMLRVTQINPQLTLESKRKAFEIEYAMNTEGETNLRTEQLQSIMTTSICRSLCGDSTYEVDSSDSESFIEYINSICMHLKICLNWGTNNPFTDEFLEKYSVTNLIERASSELQKHGFTLWECQKNSVCAGIIIPTPLNAYVQELAMQLGITFIPRVTNRPAFR